MGDVVDNTAQQRLELMVDGHPAAAFYKRDGFMVSSLLLVD
jgi:hypothetical protein